MSESNGDLPVIKVTENGPYVLEGEVEVLDAVGEDVSKDGKAFLCRCGHSRNKPFCDGSHNKIDFDGSETADRGSIADRSRSYESKELTVHDDRSICSHAAECTERLPEVWRIRGRPWIDPSGAPADEVREVVPACPSGALRYVEKDGDEPVEEPDDPAVRTAVDGPYELRGGIAVEAADGTAYEVRNRQALCRCGLSSNKPFCDGSHRDSFKDPEADPG